MAPEPWTRRRCVLRLCPDAGSRLACLSVRTPAWARAPSHVPVSALGALREPRVHDSSGHAEGFGDLCDPAPLRVKSVRTGDGCSAILGGHPGLVHGGRRSDFSRGGDCKGDVRPLQLGDCIRLAGTEQSELDAHPGRARPPHRAGQEHGRVLAGERQADEDGGTVGCRMGGLDEQPSERDVPGHAWDLVERTPRRELHQHVDRDTISTTLLGPRHLRSP